MEQSQYPQLGHTMSSPSKDYNIFPDTDWYENSPYLVWSLLDDFNQVETNTTLNRNVLPDTSDLSFQWMEPLFDDFDDFDNFEWMNIKEEDPPIPEGNSMHVPTAVTPPSSIDPKQEEAARSIRPLKPPQKRKRVLESCTECRRRKLKVHLPLPMQYESLIFQVQ
jgi:hypothetical protein